MKIKLILALVAALMSMFGYFTSQEKNPVTGQMQRVALSPEQEVMLGRKAAPEMAQQHGGLSPDREGQAIVDRVGQRLVGRGLVGRGLAGQTPYKFDFHLLRDQRTINAFALPGGQIFITEALARKLRSEGEMAGVLGHEVGHVIERHAAEHLAKAQLLQGLGGAAVIAAYDPDRPGSSYQHQVLAQAMAQLLNMKFGREDELESDRIGVKLMADAGYDPRGMIRVMQVLAEAGRSRGQSPEFFSTHPNPENRLQRIKEMIEREYPQGVPAGMER